MSVLRRGLLMLASVLTVVLGVPALAHAHVSVSGSSTVAGSSTILTFKVPVESDTAHTIGLTVQFPAGTPFASVLVEPVPGWTATLKRVPAPGAVTGPHGGAVDTVVSEVTWTATAGGLAPGEFGRFVVSVSPLPSGGTVYLPAVQRYSDGSEVSWVQQTQDEAHAEYPAPSLTVTAAGGPGVGDHGTEDHAGRWGLGFGIAGVVLALIAAGVGGFALARTRR